MNFSAKDFLVEGSQIYKKNFLKLLGINLLILLILLAAIALFSMIIGATMINTINGYEYDMYNMYSMPNIPTGTIILFVLFVLLILVFSPVLYAGYSMIYVKLAREEDTGFLDLFSGFSNFWHVWLTQYFSSTLVFGGMLLFLLPLFIVFFLSVGVDLINSLPWIMYSSMPIYSYSPSLALYFVIFFIVFIAASAYWGLKFFLNSIAAVDKKFKAAKAIFYGSQITNSYKFKILLAILLPFILYILVSILTEYVLDSDSWFSIIFSLVFTFFIYTPWLTSIIGGVYNKLANNYDNPTTDNTENQKTTNDAYTEVEKEKPIYSEEPKNDFKTNDSFTKDKPKFMFDQDNDNTVDDDGDDDNII